MCFKICSFCGVSAAIVLLTMNFLLSSVLPVTGFSSSTVATTLSTTITTTQLFTTPSGNTKLPKVQKITGKRRKELGINDNEDEYDLEMALDNNTDPIITKIIAGSLIVSIISLLIYGIVIPATTDYGEGVCNALLTGGRC
jgi:hypothetical protein